MVAERGLEDSEDVVAVVALAALGEDELLDEGEGAAGPPARPALGGEERAVVAGEEAAVVARGEGLAVDAVEGVEVLGEAELGALFGFDEFVLGDEEAPLLGVIALDGAVLAVVSHVRLQIGLFAGPILSTNYLTSTIPAKAGTHWIPCAAPCLRRREPIL